MQAHNHHGSLLWDYLAAGQARTTISIPADRYDSDMLNRLIDAVFDQLGKTVIELRVWEQPDAHGVARQVGATHDRLEQRYV